MNTTRRHLLGGAGAVIIASALPFRAQAQSASKTTLSVSKTGRVTFPETANGVSLSRVQRATLGAAATAVAAAAPTRAAANATISAIARTAMTGSARFGIYGLAAAAAIGGAYYLWTGSNPLDAVLNLGVQYDGGAAEGLTLSVPCDCSSVPVNGGNYPDSIVMGWFKNNASCTQGIAYRLAIVTNESAHDTTANPAPPGFQWAYTQILETGVRYRHFYSTPYKAQSTCTGTDRLNLPANTDVGKTLSSTDKLKLLAQNSLDALGISLWTGVGKGSSWTGGGFTGGGGGSFGGGGATGYWVDPAPAKQKAVQAGKTGTVIDPLPQAVRGTGDDAPTPTVGEIYDPWTPSADPGEFQFPDTIPFPDDTPTGGGTTPTPTPTPTPSTGGGSTGGSSSPEWDWTKYLPSMPSLGLPSVPEMVEGALPVLAAPAIAAPTIAATCADPGISFPFPSGVSLTAGVTWSTIEKTLPVCQMVTPLSAIAKPFMTVAAYFVAAWRVAKRL